eukprot:gene26954-32568_t
MQPKLPKLPGKELEQRFKLPKLCNKYDGSGGDDHNDVVIKIFVDMNVGIGGDIWPAADIFCSWMTLPQYANFFASIFNDRRILELGSGNSLVSILVEKAFSPLEVVVSDLESHVAHMQSNLERNDCRCSKAVAIDWTDDEARCEEKFDVILALECLYREFLYEPLIKTMLNYSHEHGIMILGVTRAFVKSSFFDLLQKYGLSFRKLPAEMLGRHMPYDASIGLFVLKRKQH